MAFDPCRVPDVASINRAVLDGRPARDLLSSAALAELAGLPRAGVRSALDRALAAGGAGAGAVADEYGRRLGALLAALLAGRRDVRPEWDAGWWERWTGTRTVWLAGGLAGGAFGARVAAVAGERAGCRVVVADRPEDLPLLGAARLAPPGGVVLDFGHTHVKRAVTATGTATGPATGTAAGLRRLRTVAAPPDDADGQRVADAVGGTVAATRAEAGHPPGPVVASMAAYVIDGMPVRTRLGTYARMADVGPDLGDRLARRAGARVHLVHDGTAAAHAVPPDDHAVVVLLGTSLGVGFPHRCSALG